MTFAITARIDICLKEIKKSQHDISRLYLVKEHTSNGSGNEFLIWSRKNLILNGLYVLQGEVRQVKSKTKVDNFNNPIVDTYFNLHTAAQLEEFSK